MKFKLERRNIGPGYIRPVLDFRIYRPEKLKTPPTEYLFFLDLIVPKSYLTGWFQPPRFLVMSLTFSFVRSVG